MRTSSVAILPPNSSTSARGLIISGGPASVYDPDSPKVDPAILRDGHPVLGICYGQQLMAYLLGGGVRKGEQGRVRARDAEPHGRDRQTCSPAARRRARSG